LWDRWFGALSHEDLLWKTLSASPWTTNQISEEAVLTCDTGSMAEPEAAVCSGSEAGAVVLRATSTLLPVPLPVPTVAVVGVPTSSASSTSVSLFFPLPFSFCGAVLPVIRDSLDELLWP
jgi:hypothetical protein